MPLQPLTTKNIDLSKPIVQTPRNIGDVYFDGIVWKVVAAKADFVMAMQECTEAVRAAGRIYAPDGVAWSVAAWELAHPSKFDPNTMLM